MMKSKLKTMLISSAVATFALLSELQGAGSAGLLLDDAFSNLPAKRRAQISAVLTPAGGVLASIEALGSLVVNTTAKNRTGAPESAWYNLTCSTAAKGQWCLPAVSAPNATQDKLEYSQVTVSAFAAATKTGDSAAVAVTNTVAAMKNHTAIIRGLINSANNPTLEEIWAKEGSVLRFTFVDSASSVSYIISFFGPNIFPSA